MLSKDLATINTDSPVAFEPESARLKDLFTPEAYQYFKELEFKNLLSRFSCESPVPDVEESFRTVSELTEAESVFSKFSESADIGMYLLIQDGDLLGAALTGSADDICFLPVQGVYHGGLSERQDRNAA